MIDRSELIQITGDMWGKYGIEVKNTKVKGIYDTQTGRHGGYLVDIEIHPELKEYGDKTSNPSIRAFEEDYEAKKILWIYPQLINNPEEAKKYLTAENVIRFDKDDSFLKDFPKRNINFIPFKDLEEDFYVTNNPYDFDYMEYRGFRACYIEDTNTIVIHKIVPNEEESYDDLDDTIVNRNYTKEDLKHIIDTEYIEEKTEDEEENTL